MTDKKDNSKHLTQEEVAKILGNGIIIFGGHKPPNVNKTILFKKKSQTKNQ